MSIVIKWETCLLLSYLCRVLQSSGAFGIKKFAVLKTSPWEMLSLDALLPQLQGNLSDDDSLFIFDQLPEILVSEYRGKRVPITSIADQEKLSTGGYAQINRGLRNGTPVAVKYALTQGSGKDTSVVLRRRQTHTN